MLLENAVARVVRAQSTGGRLGFIISRPGTRPPCRVITSKAAIVEFNDSQKQILLQAGDHLACHSSTILTVEFLIGGKVYLGKSATGKITGPRGFEPTGATAQKEIDNFIAGASKETGLIILGTAAFFVTVELQVAAATGTAVTLAVDASVAQLATALGLASFLGASTHYSKEKQKQQERADFYNLMQGRGVRG